MSNWSLPGYGARHNIGYWRNLPYLGVGPGAHSSLGRYRFWQVSSPRLYVSKVKEWAGSDPQPFEAMDGEVLDTACPVGSWEHIDINTGCAETMFLGLRLLDGLDLAGATEDVGVDLELKYRNEIQESVDLGLLERQDSRLRLTSGAYLIANQVFTRFVG